MCRRRPPAASRHLQRATASPTAVPAATPPAACVRRGGGGARAAVFRARVSCSSRWSCAIVATPGPGGAVVSHDPSTAVRQNVRYTLFAGTETGKRRHAGRRGPTDISARRAGAGSGCTPGSAAKVHGSVLAAIVCMTVGETERETLKKRPRTDKREAACRTSAVGTNRQSRLVGYSLESKNCGRECRLQSWVASNQGASETTAVSRPPATCTCSTSEHVDPFDWHFVVRHCSGLSALELTCATL